VRRYSAHHVGADDFPRLLFRFVCLGHTQAPDDAFPQRAEHSVRSRSPWSSMGAARSDAASDIEHPGLLGEEGLAGRMLRALERCALAEVDPAEAWDFSGLRADPADDLILADGP
jgi:hypothetical protein